MKKVFVLLANGFELIEAMTPVDVLRRCGAEVTTVSTEEDLWVESSNSVIIKADKYWEEVNFEEGDILILPGGYPGYVRLRENRLVVSQVEKYLTTGKYVAAICGAPSLFSEHKLALQYKLTGHSSIQEDLKQNHIYTGETTTVDRNLITGIGAGHSLDFSFEIAALLFEKEVIEKVKEGMEIDLDKR